MASQITGNWMFLNSLLCWQQRKHQGPHCWTLMRGIHRCLVDSPCKRSLTCKTFPCNDVIMNATAGLWMDHDDTVAMTTAEWKELAVGFHRFPCPGVPKRSADGQDKPFIYPHGVKTISDSKVSHFTRATVLIDGWNLTCGVPNNANIHDAATCRQPAGIRVSIEPCDSPPGRLLTTHF